MQINEVIERARLMASDNEDAATVISRALDRLEWEREEVAAVMKGIAAADAGDHEPLEEFDAKFRQENGIPPRP